MIHNYSKEELQKIRLNRLLEPKDNDEPLSLPSSSNSSGLVCELCLVKLK